MLMQLPVLPPPYSTSLYPVLSAQQRGDFKVALKKRDRTCHWCGCPIAKKGRNSTLDHITPTSRGGLNTADNLVLSCRGCNLWKGNNSIDEWLAKMDVIAAGIRQTIAVHC